jgi:hypothetical protein
MDIPAVYRLDPRVAELEREVDAVKDEGGPWFCSNFVWLPVNTRLRLFVGVARLPEADRPDAPELYDSRLYEQVFDHLSRRLPPCRDCGCRRFEEQRRQELAGGHTNSGR